MPMSDEATRAFVARAVDVAEGVSAGLLSLSLFDEDSIAGVERTEMVAAGITGFDVTSMLTVQALLESYSRSAMAQARAAAVLMDSDRSPGSVISIAALSRMSCEASGTAFWLSDPEIRWDERLKRCNQLQFKAIADALGSSEKFAKEVSTSWIEGKLAEYRDEMTELVNFAKQHEWHHDGRAPSGSSWSNEIPTSTQLMRDMMTYSGESAAVGQMLYSLGSGTVHSNPILVDLALNQITPVAAQYSAAFRIKTAFRCHYLLMGRMAQWTGRKFDTSWYDELEQICEVLRLHYLCELQSLADSTDGLKEYLRHLSEVFESTRRSEG